MRSRPSLTARLGNHTRRTVSRHHELFDLPTLDEHHFRTCRGSAGWPFQLLPADGDAGIDP